MRRSPPIFVSLTLLSAVAWWGCAKASGELTTASSSSSSGTSSGSGGAGGTGGAGVDGGHDAAADVSVCVPTGVVAQHVPLDIVFLVDQSAPMQGASWTALTADLPAFFNAPASAGVSAGVVLFPYSAQDCDLDHYKTLTVPVGALPANAAALTSALPASAVGVGRPTYPALQGALLQATAHKDAYPTHKVFVVLATDGDPAGACDDSLDDVAGLAASALDYNGVQTYVVAMPGGSIADLSKIAAGGGTMTAKDATIDVNQLAPSLAAIRTAGLGCDYAIPTPPGSPKLDPDEVNFSYTPKGTGTPVTLLRALNLAGCNGQPGWYYDSNTAPTKIVLCPASCTTVQADTSAVVDALFGCKSQLN